MSWAEEDWTVGLSGRVLQKVKELQLHQDRLSRENKQKQLQLDNVNTSLEKQTAKYEEVQGELQFVQRELQSVRDEAKAAVTAKERLTQDLQTKQAQICSFEGQLDAARTLNNKLTQEVKRLEAELEKLQNSRPADTTLFSTPSWSSTSPWEYNGNRKEEKPGHRDDGQSRASHIRQRLQFSEVASAPLSRQHHKNTPHRHSADQSDVFSTPMSVFPWERDDTGQTVRRQSPSTPQTPDADVISQSQPEQRACGKERDHRAETDISLSEMRSRVSALEEELSAKVSTLKSIQNEMMQSKKELSAKELSIQRARDELSLAHTRIAKETERASGAEQRLKQVQEELKCQRQNAESSRLQHQQRTKELEKQHQRDVTELQRERQCLEKQHQQEVNKLNQELQQARTHHNTLQAQNEKLSLQKQALEKEFDALKEKLKWTEGQLQESQKKEAQTQAKLMEAVREAEGVAVSLERSKKREQALEEEGRRLSEERANALHLVKELQDQQTASAPLPPVQLSPVGHSFSPSLPSRPSAQIKRNSSTNLAERKREEDLNKRRAEITASYPSDREPGEGIDSEHISQDSESLQRERSNRNEEERLRREEWDSSDGSPANSALDGGDCSFTFSAEKTMLTNSDLAKASEDLKRENAALRSELKDAHEELQKRLEDLEAQRRAEAEARTRLKQLSRKHANQAVEKEEQDKTLRAQLDTERAETEKLRKAMAALETEMNRRNIQGEKMEREVQEEENKVLEDRESEMIELNFQLKKQLAEVKAQLALEQEERKREEEERKTMTTIDKDVDKELRQKLVELEAELEEIKRNRNNDLIEKEKLSDVNTPLTYLTLHDDELNSNVIGCDYEPLPSPVQHLLFCQSTNQHNMLVSQATAELIQEEPSVIDEECSPLVGEGQTECVEDTRKTRLQDEPIPSDLAREVERLQKENANEIERSNQYQVKLEVLQSQVTRQTQQLTRAFEKQSQHITGLLAELQEKDSALLSQNEELQRYKHELDALKALKAEQEQGKELTVREDGAHKQEADEGLMKTSRLCHEDSTHSGSTQDSTCVTRETDVRQDGGATDMFTEVLALRRENQLLKDTVDGFTASAFNTSALHADVKSQEDTARESLSTGHSAESCLMDYINAKDQESSLQTVKRSGDEGGDLERLQLQQQVVELQMKLCTLAEEKQQQAEELTMWRLSSQPAPTFDNPNTDEKPNQQQTAEMTDQGNVQESPTNVAVIRGDELLLTCSSNKLQGRMLFSRLQESNLPESRSPHPSKVTAELHEFSQIAAMIDKETEKENLDINVLNKSNTHQTKPKTVKDSEVLQLSTEKMGQVIKDVLRVSGPSQTKTDEIYLRKQEARTEATTANNDTSITKESSDRHLQTDTKSVGSQTEERYCHPSAPAALELHCASTQTEEEEDEEIVESPPVSPVPLPDWTETGDKMLLSGSFPIPSDPARLAERIRRNRTQLSAAFDDTEYEPYGLPEVVMKGFADIPTGPSCPYIVRRGLLGTTVVPALQKESGQGEETD